MKTEFLCSSFEHIFSYSDLIFYIFKKKFDFSIGYNKSGEEGYNKYTVLYSGSVSEWNGHGQFEYGIEMGYISDASDFQIGKTDFGHDFWPIHLQTVCSSTLPLRIDHCDWCGRV